MPAKPKNPAIADTATLHSTVDEIARLEVALRAKVAQRDKAIQVIRDEHDGPIEDLKKRIKTLVTLSETYCLARRGEVFPGKDKSTCSALARFGFKLGNPTLCLLNRKWTWDMVLNTLRSLSFKHFIRTVEEVDKDAIKASNLTETELATCGLRLDATERFFVEPKGDDADRITADPAAN
jgi:phage host-nuclease inhibitor protein Gam